MQERYLHLLFVCCLAIQDLCAQQGRVELSVVRVCDLLFTKIWECYFVKHHVLSLIIWVRVAIARVLHVGNTLLLHDRGCLVLHGRLYDAKNVEMSLRQKVFLSLVQQKSPTYHLAWHMYFL